MDDKKPKFDPDFPPDHETNREAARVRGLRWNPEKQRYVDADGLMRRDRFGQPL